MSVSTMWGRYCNSISASLLEAFRLGFACFCGFRGRYWIKGAQTMKCTFWIETLEFSRLKVPNSRFALHGKRPSLIQGLCAFSASNSHGLCGFFRLLLTPLSTAPSLPPFGHFLRGRSLKGRCNICVYVPVYVPVCVPVCVCVPAPCPRTTPVLCSQRAESRPHSHTNPLK